MTSPSQWNCKGTTDRVVLGKSRQSEWTNVEIRRHERAATAIPCPVPLAPPETNQMPDSVRHADGYFSKEEISQPYWDLCDNINQISFEVGSSVARKIATDKAEEGKDRDAEPSMNDTSLEHLAQQQKTQIRASLIHYEELFSSNLGATNITKNRSDLKSRSKLLYSQSHRAGPEKRK